MPLLAQQLNLMIGMQVPDRKMTNKIISLAGQRVKEKSFYRGHVRRNNEATVQETGMAIDCAFALHQRSIRTIQQLD
jgi:predicted hydrolase (HD superfamily)